MPPTLFGKVIKLLQSSIKTQSGHPVLSGLPFILSQTSGGALKFKLLQFCCVWGSIAVVRIPSLSSRAVQDQIGRPLVLKKGTEAHHYFEENNC